MLAIFNFFLPSAYQDSYPCINNKMVPAPHYQPVSLFRYPKRTTSSKPPFSTLPTELCYEIANHIRTMDDFINDVVRGGVDEPPPDGPIPQTRDRILNRNLLNFASLDKRLRKIVLPFAFQRYNLFVPSSAEVGEEFQSVAFESLRFMKKNPDFRAVVREFSLYMGERTAGVDVSEQARLIMKTLVLLLPRLPKLRSIRLQGAELDDSFLQAVTSLGPKLQHLSIIECRWPLRADDTMEEDEESHSLSLKTLRVQPGIVAYQWLRTLMSPSIQSVHADYSFPARGVRHLPNLRRLRVHEIARADARDFMKTLESSEGLEEIWLGQPFWYDAYVQRPHVLPKLRKITGDIFNCYWVQDRPVTQVEFHYPTHETWAEPHNDLPGPNLSGMIQAMGAGSVPLRQLTYRAGQTESSRWGKNEMKIILSTLPFLEVLDIEVKSEEEVSPLFGSSLLRCKGN